MSAKKYYFCAVGSIILISTILMFVYIFLYFLSHKEEQNQILAIKADTINNIIAEKFSYSNRINSYVGKQFVRYGKNDLNFILSLFNEIDKMYLFHGVQSNSQLVSWSSFDWVNSQNLQTVNSKLGIRKNPPDMSARQYSYRSKEKPWTLQVSFPVLGNPSKAWVIPAGTGITDDQGKYLGIVVVGFNIAELSNVIQSKLNNSNVSFVVLDEKQRIIIQSSDNKLDPKDSFYKDSKIAEQFQNQSGTLRQAIIIDDIKYSHYQKMSDYPYVVLTGFNQTFLKKEFYNLVLPTILEFILITFFCLIILYIFKTKIIALLKQEQNLTNSLNAVNISKTKLIRAASHDLKNYIFGISGLAKLAVEDKSAAEIKNNKELQTLKTIAEQSEEMTYFVEDLLDTNQTETGQFSLGNMAKCDIAQLIKRMVLLNNNLSIQHQIDIKIAAQNNLPKLYCDVRRIKQILNNLITNALKYSSANTSLLISAKYFKKEEQIYIEFQDEGVGMDEEEIKMALSGKGEKIDKSNIDKPIDSHGIGLPIVKHLVELHKGKLEIQSQKGQGTIVKLYFPIQKITKTKRKAISIKAENNKILLVEDNMVNIKITSKILESAGYKVKAVKNGKAAVNATSKENFDLILMDLEMPVMNGYEATRKIRQKTKYKNIPIIALTGNSDHETIGKIKDCEMNGHVDKGVGKGILDIIQNLLEED